MTILRIVWRKIYWLWLEGSLILRYLSEAIRFFVLTFRYNATHRTVKDIEKLQYSLLRRNHVLEKGMSMKNCRKGFGQEKALALINDLKDYFNRYAARDKSFLEYPLSTIKAYIEFTEKSGAAIPEIRRAYEDLIRDVGIDPLSAAGVALMRREDVVSEASKGFESLLMSRHSIRYFANEPVGNAVICKALELAQRTPSACNRQGWKTHIFEGEMSVSLLKWQGGCHGFEEELKQSVLVTANLKAFMSYEVHQAYVDGGLYAMNLINAFHSLGVAGIPLSCGFDEKKLRGLKRFNVPENEVPILIFAFGNYPEEFKVAVSTRKPVANTNTFH